MSDNEHRSERRHRRSVWLPIIASADTTAEADRALRAHVKRIEISSSKLEAVALSAGTSGLEHRRGILWHMTDPITGLLERAHIRGGLVGNRGTRTVIFLCAGVGDQYPGMGRSLYETEPAFRRSIERADALLQSEFEIEILPFLLADRSPSSPGPLDRRLTFLRPSAAPDLRISPRTVQCAIVALEFALIDLLERWGITPSATIGHSLGEYVAAAVSGVLSPDDALRAVAIRAILIETVERGAMAAVQLGPEQLETYLTDGVTLALHNASNSAVASGPTAAIDELVRRLAGDGVACRRIETTHAFHSPALRIIEEALTRALERVQCSHPRIPYVSNVTGDWMTADDAMDTAYWVRHMCEPVRFSAGVSALCQRHSDSVVVEVGPGRTLGSFLTQHTVCSAAMRSRIIATLPYASELMDPSESLYTAVMRMWLVGAHVQWEQLWADQLDGHPA